ncbi:PKD domain-containing protein [Candidatus Poribacteria bacterium]|nr:PKD domain-containing protein [Candidatus Poribacteria bacterium]
MSLRNHALRCLTPLVFILTLSTFFLCGQSALAQTNVWVEDLTYSGEVIATGSVPTAVLLIHATTANPYLTQVEGAEVVIHAGGISPCDVLPEDFVSVELYVDDGDGIFNSVEDGPAAGTVAGSDLTVDGCDYTAVFDEVAIAVPNDIFVVISTAETLNTGDDFSVGINQATMLVVGYPGGAPVVETGSFPAADEETFILTVVKTPKATMVITPLAGANQAILPRSGSTEVFGINASVKGANQWLYTIVVRVEDVGETSADGLEEITPSDFMVLQLYQDAPGLDPETNGVFNPPGGENPPDILIGEVEIPQSSENTPFYLIWQWSSAMPHPYLPADDVNVYAGNDFFVTIRTSDSIDSDFDMVDLNRVDDFKMIIEPYSVWVTSVSGAMQFFPPLLSPDIETSAITTEALVLDLWPIAMDRTDDDTKVAANPGASLDLPEDALRYAYSIPGQSLRIRYLGERDREFTGIGENTYEGFHHSFEQPVVAQLERRQNIIGLDIAGGTTSNPEVLAGLTLTLSNVGGDLLSLYEFNPLLGLDSVLCCSSYFCGIAVYEDTNNDGKYTEPTLDPLTYTFDPDTGDQPVDFDFWVSPLPGFPYHQNPDATIYMLQLAFTNPPYLETFPDRKSDFFVVMRPDSGWLDDSGTWGDGTAINFGADFKISLERAEDLDGDGTINVAEDRSDFNLDGLPQTPPVIFERANPRDGLVILADNSAAPSIFRQTHKLDGVVDAQDLSFDFELDLDQATPIQQRIDATSLPTALLALNAATSEVPQLNLIDEPITLTEIRLNFSGDGFNPDDISEIFLVRDDKSPYLRAGRTVGVFDIFNDLWNLPPPESNLNAPTNPDEDSPVALTPWTWQNDGADYVVLTPEIPPRLYSHDMIEEDASVDVFTDNFEMIQSPYTPGLQIPRDTVFTGADYFVVVETSDSISYDDELKIEIPIFGLAFSNGLTTIRSVDLFDPENPSPDSNIKSVRANVPVELHDLVASGQSLASSSGYTPVIGFNMYTNRSPAAQGGVDVYFEQLVVAFLQYGTHDSFNLASDLLPFENVNGANTVNSGIQLYHDANGNGRFDGPGVDTLVPMDVTPALGLNPSRIGLAGEESNQVLMVFSSDQNKQLIPAADTDANEGDDFFLVIRTSSVFDPVRDSFSVALISWGPDSPTAPAPHTVSGNRYRPYEALNTHQAYPFTRRGIGFVDSNGIRTRSNETINTNVFNSTSTTLLNAVDSFNGNLCAPEIENPIRQVLLTWDDTNSDNAATLYVDENESGYWIEADIYGEFAPLPVNPLPADETELQFDGPSFLAGRTVTFRIYPFRNNIDGNPLSPPFNGPGPAATTSVTFATSVLAVPPTADFAGSPADTVCVGQSVQFTSLATCGPTAWLWEFGDGATSAQVNPVHTYALAGSYTVRLTVSNAAGSDSLTRTAFITVSPIVAGLSGDPVSGNGPLTVQFTDESLCNPTSWLWEFGDAETSTQQNPAHVYTDAGTYTVTLTVTNAGGTDSVTLMDYVTVSAPPQADFETIPPGDVCVGTTVQFTDLSSGIPTSWAWDFGDGYTSDVGNPSHQYAGAGAYMVCLQVTNDAGSDTLCKPITVSEVVSDFSADVTSGCAPLNVQFTDLSQCDPTIWQWNLGDGQTSTEQNPAHIYSNVGTYNVSLNVTSVAGSDTMTKNGYVTVGGTPVAGFTALPAIGQAPLPVAFTDTSAGNPSSWQWNFGDGSAVSTLRNPSHTFTTPGTYQVCLTAANGCGSDTFCSTVTAQSAPALALSTTILNNSTMRGANAPSQTFEIWNSGQGTLSYTVSENVFWLSCSPISGSSAGEHDIITVQYSSSGLNPGNYSTTVTVTSAGVGNSPQTLTVNLNVAESELTQINLVSPWNSSSLSAPPTFVWSATGGINNVFSVDLSYSPDFKTYWSTYKNLHQTISGNSWTMPQSLWNQITAGKPVYWKVDGADLNHQPTTIVNSLQIWSFTKR